MSCVLKCIKLFMKLMIIKKIILGISLIALLSGCVQSTSFLGPVYALGTTGSVHHAGFSYRSAKLITTFTGKSSLANLDGFLRSKKHDSDLRKLVKRRIKETIKKLNLNK